MRESIIKLSEEDMEREGISEEISELLNKVEKK